MRVSLLKLVFLSVVFGKYTPKKVACKKKQKNVETETKILSGKSKFKNFFGSNLIIMGKALKKAKREKGNAFPFPQKNALIDTTSGEMEHCLLCINQIHRQGGVPSSGDADNTAISPSKIGIISTLLDGCKALTPGLLWTGPREHGGRARSQSGAAWRSQSVLGRLYALICESDNLVNLCQSGEE